MLSTAPFDHKSVSEGRSGAPLGDFWEHLGVPWGGLDRSWGRSWGFLGPSWVPLGINK